MKRGKKKFWVKVVLTWGGIKTEWLHDFFYEDVEWNSEWIRGSFKFNPDHKKEKK